MSIHERSRYSVQTIVMIATFAIGIGSIFAISSALYTAFIANAPLPDGERIVYIWNRYPGAGLDRAATSVPDFVDRNVSMDALESQALFRHTELNLVTDNAEPIGTTAARVTPSFFSVVSTEPTMGRRFFEEDSESGKDQVVVLSDRLWTVTFGGNPNIIGTQIRLNNIPHVVIGVMPGGFSFPDQNTDMWIPLSIEYADTLDSNRGNERYSTIGRLKKGMSIAVAREQAASILAVNMERMPGRAEMWRETGFETIITSYSDEWFGRYKRQLVFLQMIALLVLLVICTNIAVNAMARSMDMTGEVALNKLLGARDLRIALQSITWTTRIVAIGSLLGFFLGLVGIYLFRVSEVFDSTSPSTVSIQWGAVVVGVVLAVVCGIVISIIPIIMSKTVHPVIALRETLSQQVSSSIQWSRVRGSFVIVQVGLSVVALNLSIAMVQAYVAQKDIDLGFAGRNVAIVDLLLSEQHYQSDSQIAEFARGVTRELLKIPTVENVGTMDQALLTVGRSSHYTVRTSSGTANELLQFANTRTVSADFFSALGIDLLEGRSFRELESANSKPVAVVDDTFVAKHFSMEHEAAIGELVQIGATGTEYEIIGVVNSAAIEEISENARAEAIYISQEQAPKHRLFFVIRTDGTESALLPQVRNAVSKVDDEQAIFGFQLVQDLVSKKLQVQKMISIVVTVLAIFSVGISMIGTYGTIAYFVKKNRFEFGVRAVLGTSSIGIANIVFRKVALLLFFGAVLGVLSTRLFTQLVSTAIMEISLSIQVTIACIIAICAAVFISVVPAIWQVMRQSPASLLK